MIRYIDQHADRLGYQPQTFGATVCAIVDPQATAEVNFIQCFADLEEASECLPMSRIRKSTLVGKNRSNVYSFAATRTPLW